MIIPKEVIKSRRKTLALVIDHDGELIVRAPFSATNSDIRYFIEQKEEWIREKSIAVKAKAQKHPVLSLQDGETILYLGKEHAIHRTLVDHVVLTEEMLHIPDTAQAKEVIIKWYKRRAAAILAERVAIYASRMGVTPSGISITSAKTRWGSCSYKNHLNFTWRLIMCPMEVVDYVVVHELSHIEHKDHSKAFWNCVAEVDTMYQEHEKWLKDNQTLVEVI